jgi:hypothetical protein
MADTNTAAALVSAAAANFCIVSEYMIAFQPEIKVQIG